MNIPNQHLLAFVLKMFGIFVVLKAFTFAAPILNASLSRNVNMSWDSLISSSVIFFGFLIGGGYFIFFSEREAARIASKWNYIEDEPATTKEIQGIAFSVLGLALMAFAIPDLTTNLMDVYLFLSHKKSMFLLAHLSFSVRKRW